MDENYFIPEKKGFSFAHTFGIVFSISITLYDSGGRNPREGDLRFFYLYKITFFTTLVQVRRYPNPEFDSTFFL